LPVHEKPSEAKHVESILFPCLDEGSTPSSSTINLKEQLKACWIEKFQQAFYFSASSKMTSEKIQKSELPTKNFLGKS
jgi:hypothetical protein